MSSSRCNPVHHTPHSSTLGRWNYINVTKDIMCYSLVLTDSSISFLIRFLVQSLIHTRDSLLHAFLSLNAEHIGSIKHVSRSDSDSRGDSTVGAMSNSQECFWSSMMVGTRGQACQ